MRYIILGAGVIGCYVGGRLAHAGHTVCFVGRPSHDDNALVVLVCVKATATDEVALDIAAQCPAGTTVVSLQNGVENVARLLAVAPTMTVLASVVAFNVIWRDANHVFQTTDGSLLVQQDPSSEVFAPVFRQAGVPVDLYRDMVAVKWGKLLLNLVNPVNALANISLRDTFMQRDRHRLAHRCKPLGEAQRWINVLLRNAMIPQENEYIT